MASIIKPASAFSGRASQRGIVLVTFAISLLVLLLFFGLAVDIGFLYMTRAALSKGTDAAALMGVRSLGKGEAVARDVANSTFAMNYAVSGMSLRQADVPAVSVSFANDADGNKRITVDAQVQINTFILGVLPQFATMDVGSSAQAARARLIMGMVLDRSGSMSGNGGSAALAPAVTTFIDFFDETFDRVGLASYADHATSDVGIGSVFKAPIKNKVKTMNFSGWTYAHGGIDIGRAQVKSVPLLPTENSIRAVVFFTDGHANSFLSSVDCNGSVISLVIAPGSDVDDFRSPATGAAVTCKAKTTKTFYSQQYQTNLTRNTNSVTAEGKFRAEASAALARNDKMLVFAIGLGNAIDKASLRKMANDPASPDFNPAQPEGLAVFAPTAAELDDVFRQIAARILLRLTR